jgi:DNA-binding transcriptional ArsR family regulator
MSSPAPPAAALDRVFSALADPTRRAILARLVDGEATVNELIAPFHLSQPAISKHLKVLEQAGLVMRGRAAQTRPVRLNPEPLGEAARWLGHYRRFWEDSFDKLDALLQADAPAAAKSAPHPRAAKPATRPSRKGKTHARKSAA